MESKITLELSLKAVWNSDILIPGLAFLAIKLLLLSHFISQISQILVHFGDIFYPQSIFYIY